MRRERVFLDVLAFGCLLLSPHLVFTSSVFYIECVFTSSVFSFTQIMVEPACADNPNQVDEFVGERVVLQLDRMLHECAGDRVPLL